MIIKNGFKNNKEDEEKKEYPAEELEREREGAAMSKKRTQRNQR